MTACNSSIDSDLVKKAETELQEKEEWRERDILALKDMILSSNFGLNSCLDSIFLLRFLRARKFDYDKAFELLVKYYSSRSLNQNLFLNFVPSAVQHVFDNNFQGMLSHRDPNGRVVFIYRAGIWDPNKCSVDDIFRANMLSFELAIESEATQVNGIVAVVDLAGLSLNQCKHFTPSYMKKIISVIQDSFPARFKAFHVVHESAFVDMLFAVIRPFLNPKIRNRIHFHGDSLASLHSYIPADILPLELGGKTGPFNNADWYEKLLSKEELFIDRAKYGLMDGFNINHLDSYPSIFGTYKRVCID